MSYYVDKDLYLKKMKEETRYILKNMFYEHVPFCIDDDLSVGKNKKDISQTASVKRKQVNSSKNGGIVIWNK